MIKFISMAVIIVLCGVSYAYGRIDASAEWDQSADFRRLKTYAWLPESPERMQDSEVNYMLLEPRVKGSADIDLQYKGYKKAEDGVPADFMIGYHVIKNEESTLSNVNGFYGYEPVYDYWGTGTVVSGDTYTERFTRGTLILDIVDTASKKLIWRGYASAVVDPGAPLEDKTEIIQDATGEILTQILH